MVEDVFEVISRMWFVSCRQIPHPIVLASTALVNEESELSREESVTDEMRSNTVKMINSLRNLFSVGGRPDAVSVRSQHTYLASDFVILHQSNTRKVTHLAESLRHKGWSEINFSAPEYTSRCGMGATEEALRRMVTDIEAMNEDIRAQLTVHVHISLQGAVEDNMQWFLSEDAIRSQIQARLLSAIVNPIVDAAKLTARPPIININHDTRFNAKGKPEFAKKLGNFIGFHAMGSYLMLELRARGCIVIHGSSFWSKIACDLHQSHDCVYKLSNEPHGEGDNHIRFRRAFAVYEKQLFSEKMVMAGLLNPEQLQKWNDNVSVQTISAPNLVQICEDRAQVTFTTPIDVGQWFSQENIARIQSGAQSDGFAEHASVTWQEFDIAMTTPEAYYDQRHYWFKIDDYSTNSNVSVPGKVYFCPGCEEAKDINKFKASVYTASGNGYPTYCIGCAYVAALKNQTHFSNYDELESYHKYALACAVYVYDSSLQFFHPHHDICEFIKECVPAVYKEHGKVVSHFGALRVTVQQACEYAGCGKAKQLGWDRAYNKEGELCYICYYDGGNAAYAGFMRALLSPTELQQLFGSTNVKEELLGDTLEFTLGVLTIATRYPRHFPNWGGPETTNACIRGIERSFWVYANIENIKLVTAPTPRHRNPPKREAEICGFIAEMTDVLSPGFLAIMLWTMMHFSQFLGKLLMGPAT